MGFLNKYFPQLFLCTPEEESEHEEGFEATRDYSQMKMFTGKSPTPLEDVNTKVYIGSEVNGSQSVEVCFHLKIPSAFLVFYLFLLTGQTQSFNDAHVKLELIERQQQL